MADEIRETQNPPPERNLRMKFGTDLRYHFEDEALRRKGGDNAEFQWIETTFLESGFFVNDFSG